MSSLVWATIVPENCETEALRPLSPKTRESVFATARLRVGKGGGGGRGFERLSGLVRPDTRWE